MIDWLFKGFASSAQKAVSLLQTSLGAY